MKTQVSELYHSTKEKYSMTLHSGEAGLTNSVSWIYLAEDFQNMSFLKGGELVITTGLFTRSGIALFDFIRSLVTHNCSGILINVGQYIHIEELTEEIIEFCITSEFPLFTIPWDVHLVDIMQDYCRTLLQSTQRTDELNAAFQSAVYQANLHESTLLTLNRYGFATDDEYRIIVMQNLQNTTRVTFALNHRHFKYHLFEHDNRQVLIYQPSRTEMSFEEVLEILLFCDSIILGISNVFSSLKEFSLCYKRSRFALASAVFWNIPLVNFEELGIFQILFSSSDPEMLKDICQKKLGKLEAYDSAHETDYLTTLRIFLLSDCNLLETSDRLHTHRNTVIYRMKKIKELLGSEINDSKVKFDLLMAFYIREYFLIY